MIGFPGVLKSRLFRSLSGAKITVLGFRVFQGLFVSTKEVTAAHYCFTRSLTAVRKIKTPLVGDTVDGQNPA